VARPGLQIDINLERPQSLGTVRLRSADPLDHPRIDPNFLSHPGDIDALVRGVAAMREVMARPEIARYHQGEIGVWKDAVAREHVVEAIRETAYTGHHPCSTARMGTDLDAVLDEQLRVRGIDGLRVCDAAAMPTQITGNLYATVVAMAEKAADMILQRPAPPPEYPGETPAASEVIHA
jgi:choline dehydrogenase